MNKAMTLVAVAFVVSGDLALAQDEGSPWEIPPEASAVKNPLDNTAEAVAADDWVHPYTRSQAAFPVAWVREHKYWPPVGRIDNAYGDRNLICTCPPLEELSD